MEPFMKTNGDFRRPIDMAIGKGGDLYILEYGSVWRHRQRRRATGTYFHNGGNRAPVAAITTADTAGTAPTKVNFSSKKSYDFDEGQALEI